MYLKKDLNQLPFEKSRLMVAFDELSSSSSVSVMGGSIAGSLATVCIGSSTATSSSSSSSAAGIVKDGFAATLGAEWARATRTTAKTQSPLVGRIVGAGNSDNLPDLTF